MFYSCRDIVDETPPLLIDAFILEVFLLEVIRGCFDLLLVGRKHLVHLTSEVFNLSG